MLFYQLQVIGVEDSTRGLLALRRLQSEYGCLTPAQERELHKTAKMITPDMPLDVGKPTTDLERLNRIAHGLALKGQTEPSTWAWRLTFQIRKIHRKDPESIG